LLRAKTYYEKAGSKAAIPALLGKIGRVCAESHDYIAAEKWYLQGKKLALEINDFNSAGIATNALGILYKTQNLYPKALAQFQEVLRILDKTNNKNLLLAVYNNIGNVYDKMGESKKALEYGKKALNIAEQLKVPLGIARQQVSLGLAYNTLQSYDSALRLFNAALPVLSKAKTNADLLTTYEAIIKASTGLSNHKQAVTYYQKYNSLKDSLQREEQNTALDSLRVKFNTEQTINENLLLAQKNLVQSKTISLQKTIMASAFLFAFLLTQLA
jgi:tetratricopeptide (TPR) repeat protein